MNPNGDHVYLLMVTINTSPVGTGVVIYICPALTGWKPVLLKTHGQDARATLQTREQVARATKKKARSVLSHRPSRKSGNDLLSRSLSLYYHWLLRA